MNVSPSECFQDTDIPRDWQTFRNTLGISRFQVAWAEHPLPVLGWTIRRLSHWWTRHPLGVMARSLQGVVVIIVALLVLRAVDDRATDRIVEDERYARAEQARIDEGWARIAAYDTPGDPALAAGMRNAGLASTLENLNESGESLAQIWLPRAYLVGVVLEGADLGGSMLAGAHLWGANLDGAGLNLANLEGAFLAQASLVGADLAGARLVGAQLLAANLEGANLDGADLEGAGLSQAQLSGARLRGARLTGIDLTGADFDVLDLSEACGENIRGWPEGLEPLPACAE